MSRIYTITDRMGCVVRYVRAHTLNGAVRAYANEHFKASASSTDELFQAQKAGEFDVLDAIDPEQRDIEDPEVKGFSHVEGAAAPTQAAAVQAPKKKQPENITTD